MSSGKNPTMNVFLAVESNPTMMKEFKNLGSFKNTEKLPNMSMVVASLSSASTGILQMNLQRVLIVFQRIINQPAQIAGT